MKGYKFADALSISSYAAAHNMPILMTNTDILPEETEKIFAEQFTILGGYGLIPYGTESIIRTEDP